MIGVRGVANKIVLEPHQELAMQKALTRKHGFLNTEIMGKGKTLTTIFTVNELVKQRGYKSVVICCPANVKKVWKDNSKYFEGVDIDIYSYSYISRNDIRLVCDILILDESHNLKNFRSKANNHISRFCKKYTFLLSGTPIEKSHIDLWSQLKILNPKLFGTYWDFVRDYCVLDYFNQICAYKNTQKWMSLVNGYAYNSGGLERDYIVNINDITVPISTDQQGYINKINRDMCLIHNGEYRFITTKAHRYKEIQNATTGLFCEPTNLLQATNKIVKRHNNQVVILYNFVHEKKWLLKQFPEAYEYSGQKKELEDYLANGGILIAQIQAIGEGTDGIQHRSSTLIFFSMNWSYRLNVQARGRIDRRGQINDCNIYYLMTDSIVDRAVKQALENKRDLNEKFLDNLD